MYFKHFSIIILKFLLNFLKIDHINPLKVLCDLLQASLDQNVYRMICRSEEEVEQICP